MRPQKVADHQLLTSLMGVFRAKGYDGASLNELADSCGLKKASLYHRFPGGKKDIGIAVLNFLEEWKNKHIESVVNHTNLRPEEKLEQVIANLDEIYLSGQTGCVMRALSMGSGLEMFNEELKTSSEAWLRNFSKLAIDFGKTDEEAGKIAMQVLVKIQGSLVVSNTLQSTVPFNDTLLEIKGLFRK